MRGFILGDFDSLASGCRVTSPPAVSFTARATTDVEVAGGEGIITRTTGWSPRTLSIGLLAPSLDVVEHLAGTATHSGLYLRLSHLPGRYLITTKGSVSELSRFGTRWKATLEVTCRPFTYLDAGLTPVPLRAGGVVRVVNPTLLDSRPVITLSGSGTTTITINNTPYRVVLPGSGELVIDCGSMTCTVSGKTLTDALLALDFPVLVPGVNTLALPAGVSGRLIPMWRTP
ncbi:MAG: hypothetical protein MR522_04585 [Trueperella sp.]|uniref:hypothetical protein n=1 Tax=Trueperella sp. TaxID=2699835 RepID=UPI0025D650BD|nr:hypothetical protein [Trueperella sp.]MCI7305525.1 hypothetical protein [Trueperella sp.]